MAIVRLYTGSDDRSYFEELDLGSNPDLASMRGAEGVKFRKFEAGFSADWHLAPRRQYVVTLSGEIRVGIGDGTHRNFIPGDVLLAEDLKGQGHTFAVVSKGPWIQMTVPLTE